MHSFDELIERCTHFVSQHLDSAQASTTDSFQISGATELVKVSQMIRLQKVVISVGIFSIFEARLQGGLSCKDGFASAKQILRDSGSQELLIRFEYYQRAVNVLKHGQGSSYDYLISKKAELPFRIRSSEEPFFHEGDVSEVNVLVDVDDDFMKMCAQIIREVAVVLRAARPELVL